MQDASPPATATSNSVASIHYLEPKNYDEALSILVEFSGFILSEALKPEPLDQTKLGNMLNIYISNCLRKGPPAGTEAPTGASCQHLYIKGENSGKLCGKPAKFKGVEGLPKCSSHKTSKPGKQSTSAEAAASAASTGQTFSYAANQGKGKTDPQTLTTIQQSIVEHTGPSELSLARAPDGRLYNHATGIVFEIRPEGFVAVGVMDGPVTSKLSVMEANVCYGNKWKWDPACVEDDYARDTGHPLIISADHPLIAGRDGSLINKKIESVSANSNL